MEFQIGEIDSGETDLMELLLPLVKKLEAGMKTMNPKGDDDCTFIIHCIAGGELKLHFEEAEVEVGAEVLVDRMLVLHINGAYKYLCMMEKHWQCCTGKLLVMPAGFTSTAATALFPC